MYQQAGSFNGYNKKKYHDYDHGRQSHHTAYTVPQDKPTGPPTNTASIPKIASADPPHQTDNSKTDVVQEGQHPSSDNTANSSPETTALKDTQEKQIVNEVSTEGTGNRRKDGSPRKETGQASKKSQEHQHFLEAGPLPKPPDIIA